MADTKAADTKKRKKRRHRNIKPDAKPAVTKKPKEDDGKSK